MGRKVDWDNWRTKFIQGPDELDLKTLSEYKDAPAYQSLRNRSSQEDWPQQRKRYRDNSSTLASTVPEVKDVASTVTKIIDSAEMLTRHSQLARLMGSISAHELKEIRRKQLEHKPTGLRATEILQYAKAAVETERITEGLATERQQVDFKALSDSELEKLANGG
jgi:hypothetical protein